MAWDELYKGDCLQVMNELDTGRADLILCDLPYGTTECAWDSVIDLVPLWKHFHRIAKESAAIVLCADEPFTSRLVMSNVEEFRYRWTWIKRNPTGFMNANRMPLKNVEDVCVFYRRLPVYNPQGIKYTGKKRNSRGSVGRAYGGHGISNDNIETEYTNHPRQTLDFGRDGTIDKAVHPTQKPLALMSYFVRTYSNPGDTVLDCCMGSGTTGVAALALDRNFIGIEQDSNYYALAKKRIAQARSPFDRFRGQTTVQRSEDARPSGTRPTRVKRTR